MVSTSKILTVSYGTFSCTLEGFDDSFETMKAIAEYFRDLAADDRYFGAEPPVPDAEMLARIAEREIARRVEARTERGNIVLRAADATPSQIAAPAMAPLAATAVAVATPAAPAPDADLAAKLQRIRAAVATQSADYAEDEHAEGLQVSDNSALDALLADGLDDDAVANDAADPANALTEAPNMDALEDAPLAQADSSEPDAADTALDPVWADGAEEDDFVDDLDDHAADMVDDAGLADAYEEEYEDDYADLAAAEQAQVPDTRPVAEAGSADTRDAEIVTEEEDDDVAALLDRLAGLGAPAEASAHVAPQAPEPEVAPAPAPEPLRARVVKVKRADLDAAIAAGQLEAEDEDEDDFAIDLAAFADDSPQDGWQNSAESTLSPEEEAALRSELAAVEAEFARDGTAQDEIADDSDESVDGPQVESRASEEDEDEVDFSAFIDDEESDDYLDDSADLDDGDDPIESIFAEHADDTPDLQQRRSPRGALETPSSERDVTRLMAKTISEMDEPESASRRSAIAHLRAAVAATRADKAAGVPRREDTMSDVFRADLAQVVRPRRPRNDSSPTARPVEPIRPAPLKLVAEQRIDTPLAPTAPVRPRRISVTQFADPMVEDSQASGELASGFAEYVDQTGAHGLHEILEAAAAYLAFVEGRDAFSRPLLMTRARAAIGEDFNREDGLRSFGQLLRQGKIQKLKGGRFTVSQEIGFQPSERRAG